MEVMTGLGTPMSFRYIISSEPTLNVLVVFVT
jgi:hypothetical protein